MATLTRVTHAPFDQSLPEGLSFYQTRKCPFCSESSVYLMADADVMRLVEEFVQDVFPHTDANFRESLISGTHGTCWDAAFPEEEEE